MHLRCLELRDFRNLGVQGLVFPPEGVALVGDNAQGKSNLLEAIYYLETLRSFRGATDAQLVAFGQDVFRIEAHVEREASAHEPSLIAAAFRKGDRTKRVSLGGEEVPRLSDGLGNLPAVIFSPADIQLVSGGPGERRRFLDIVLSLNRVGYLEALQRYRQVLAQRNAALKTRQPAAAVAAWNAPLVGAGAEVMEARRAWIQKTDAGFRRYYETVAGGRGAGLAYRPSVAVDKGGESRAAFEEGLTTSRDRERRMGTTVVGPHRDEMWIQVEGASSEALDLRDYGSGGQKRTAALALRLAEADTVREARGAEPIMLMDDVFAELDEGRSERVLDLVERQRGGQVILTAPKESDVRFGRETLSRWTIDAGRIRS